MIPVNASFAGRRWPRFTTYRFARRLLGSPIGLSEISLVASYAPFVFKRIAGRVTPYMLFSLDGGRNVFVDERGRWRGPYVPAALRSYPFAMTEDPKEDDLLVDEQSAIAPPDARDVSVPYYDVTGEMSEETRKVRRFLLERKADMQRTRRVVDMIVDSGLLIPFKYEKLTRSDRSQIFILNQKLLAVSPRRYLPHLPADTTLQALVHAHAISLIQIGRLQALHVAQQRPPDPSTTALDGFLEALQEAQWRD
ncbi:SapC family protein [Pontivivens ytuae]|uniref:SapC family protein n=1 Tax=Pontivivens ytuae TaxID=2789856 RepID=UPI001E2B9FE1|nr:SapC family protein [Pontivivens ytuae]